MRPLSRTVLVLAGRAAAHLDNMCVCHALLSKKRVRHYTSTRVPACQAGAVRAGGTATTHRTPTITKTVHVCPPHTPERILQYENVCVMRLLYLGTSG